MIEVTTFEKTKDVQNLDVMLHALRVGEPYAYWREIPDTASIAAADIVQAGKEIESLFAQKPLEHGTEDGECVVPIGKTGYDIRIRSAKRHLSGGASVYHVDPFRAIYEINCRLKKEAPQLPDVGGAVILDIGTADEHVSNLTSQWLNDPSMCDALWRKVPVRVHSLWLYRWRGEDGKPLMMNYIANPYAEVVMPPIVAELRSGPLKDGFFPAYDMADSE